MKICIINSLYKPFMRGGAETVTENIIEGLIRGGHSVVLITLGRSHELIVEQHLSIYRIKPLNLFSFIDIATSKFSIRIFWHIFDIFNVSSRIKIKKILQKEKVDFVWTHNLKGIGYLIPGLVRKLDITHIHTVHDVQLIRPSGLLIYNHEKPFLILDLIYEKICRWLFGSPNFVVFPSRWIHDFYKVRGFFYASNKSIIKNPVGFQEMQKIEMHEHKKSQENKVQFLYLGQLEKFKGILFLIETLKQLERKNWILRIVGGGSLENVIQQKIQGDEHFLYYGFVKRAKLSNIFGQTDCTILPSLCYENSPTVIMESFAAGVPIVASDIGGIPELVKDQVNGFTFEPGNTENLKRVLLFYLSHSEMIERLREKTKISLDGMDIKNYLKNIFALVQK